MQTFKQTGISILCPALDPASRAAFDAIAAAAEESANRAANRPQPVEPWLAAAPAAVPTNNADADAANDAAMPLWAEEIEAVRCAGQPPVWLDMERLADEELAVLMPSVSTKQLEAMLPVEEFCSGSTLHGVDDALLGDDVPDVAVPQCSDESVQFFDMMHRLRRLIDSHRCLLFEQVRALCGCDFTDELFHLICSALSSPESRARFMRLSRHDRLHTIAHYRVRLAEALKRKKLQSTIA